MDKLGVGLLGPASRGRIKFVRKDAHCRRDRDALGIEISELAPILPIETGAGKRCICQPGDGDVVEDIVAAQAGGFSGKNTRDQFQAARVVIEEIRRQADG